MLTRREDRYRYDNTFLFSASTDNCYKIIIKDKLARSYNIRLLCMYMYQQELYYENIK